MHPRYLYVLLLIVVLATFVTAKFYGRYHGGRRYQSASKLPDLWKREHASTGHSYDLELEECTTDDMEIIVLSPPVPVVVLPSWFAIRGSGGGGGSGGAKLEYPPDSAMCPADECAVLPTLLQIVGSDKMPEAHVITFTKETWWYTYFAFLGKTRTTKRHKQIYYPRIMNSVVWSTGDCQ